MKLYKPYKLVYRSRVTYMLRRPSGGPPGATAVEAVPLPWMPRDMARDRSRVVAFLAYFDFSIPLPS